PRAIHGHLNAQDHEGIFQFVDLLFQGQQAVFAGDFGQIDHFLDQLGQVFVFVEDQFHDDLGQLHELLQRHRGQHDAQPSSHDHDGGGNVDELSQRDASTVAPGDEQGNQQQGKSPSDANDGGYVHGYDPYF